MVEKIKNLSLRVNIKDTLIVLLIAGALTGVSWAWFSALNTGGDLQGVTVETANLSMQFEGGPEFQALNVLPGWTATKTFSVTNTGDRTNTYKINWASVNNGFTNKADLVYSISSTNSGGTLAETQMPNTGSHVNILTNITIPTGVTQVYTITFRFLNRASTQNDQGSSWIGKLEVLDIHS